MEKKLTDVILKLSTQLEEIGLKVAETNEIIMKQKNEELLKRLERLEASMKDQHLKLDAMNAIDINPTIHVANGPVTARVAPAKKVAKVKKEDNVQVEADEEVVDDTKAVDDVKAADEPKPFSNITEYFKHLWITQRELLYEKGVLTKEEYEKIYEDNKDKFDKKKKNELVLQKSVAFQIWKTIKLEKKDIVKAMKDQNTKDIQKKNSQEIDEEVDE